MDITTKLQDDITILELDGRIDVNSAKLFHEKYEELVMQKAKKIIIDCAKLGFVSSSGLRVFLQLMKYVEQQNGKLVICALNELVYEVFEISGFVSFFVMADDLDEALGQF